MRKAVRGWSPVIMMTRMPAWCACRIAWRASGRGGSMMPTTPASVSCCSSARSGCRACSGVSARQATASVRRAASDMASTSAWKRWRCASSRAISASPSCTRALRCSSTSGAPLVSNSSRPVACSRSTTDISLRSESKGSSARRSKPCMSSPWSLSLAAATRNAPSVGSPRMRQWPSSSCSSAALLARLPPYSTHCCSWHSAGCVCSACPWCVISPCGA